MIIRVLAWTMLDESMVIEASVAYPDALGLDADPQVWRTFKGSVPPEAVAGGPADALAWLGEALLDLAYDRSRGPS